MKTITVKLPERLVNCIAETVEKYHVPQSDIIRTALTNYFAGNLGETNKSSFYEETKTLCGCFSSGKDLGSNKKNLEGYGE